MSCDGPSQEHAYLTADGLYDIFVETMKHGHIHVDAFLYEKDKKTQQDNFDKLKELIREIVWHDHASNF